MSILEHRFIDLTHTIEEDIPTWPGSQRFTRTLHCDYPQGCRIYNFLQAEGTGTHIDAPAHFIEGGKSIAEFSLEELIAPACVINIVEQVQENPDYALSVEDIILWEEQYGAIDEGDIVLIHTGWSRHWPDEQRYRNSDAEGVLHFPGFSKHAAEFLVDRHIAGVGLDTLSIDPGVSTDFAAHHVLLGNGKFQIENLVHLDQLPPRGATVFALPLKIAAGPEASARVIALVE